MFNNPCGGFASVLYGGLDVPFAFSLLGHVFRCVTTNEAIPATMLVLVATIEQA